MKLRGILWVALVAGGCEAKREVTLVGTVKDGPRSLVDFKGGGQVEVFDDAGTSYAVADLGTDGSFSVVGPGGDNVYVVITGPGVRPTVFAGVTQIDGEQAVADQEMFVITEAWFAEWQTTFAGCPVVGEPGGAVIGDIRMAGLTDPVTGEFLVVTTGFASVKDGDDTVASHCALDEEGALAPAGAYVGERGTFGIFGVPSGFYNLEVGYEFYTDEFTYEDYFLWLPSDDAVSPRFPAWVELVTG